MTTIKELETEQHPNWCPGCGDFSILSAIKKAVVELGKPKEDYVIASGIGCGSKTPHWINTYGFHSIHGRSLPVAEGIKMGNNSLEVVCVAGDGDVYGIGIGHLMHMLRRNFDITLIVQDNQVYGLTKGQTSPTSDKGYKSKTTPSGVIEEPVNPLKLSLGGGGTFVARGYSKDIVHLADLIKAGVNHKGFAIIDVLQPCVTFNKVNTYDFYSERAYKLDPNKYDPTNFSQAMKKAEEWEEKIPLGILYQVRKKTYLEQVSQISEMPLVKQPIKNVNLCKVKQRFL